VIVHLDGTRGAVARIVHPWSQAKPEPLLYKRPHIVRVRRIQVKRRVGLIKFWKAAIWLATVPIATGPPTAVPQNVGSSAPPGIGTGRGVAVPLQAVGTWTKTSPSVPDTWDRVVLRQ
jgi:hypothetical protein